MSRERNGPGRAKRAQDEHQVAPAVDPLDGERVDDVDDQATETFEDLIRKHRTPLYGAALRLTDGWAAVEDLVQDTLERAYRAFHRYRPEGKVRAWLGCILRNLWITQCRRQHGVLRTVSLEAAEEMMSYGRAVAISSPSSVETVV